MQSILQKQISLFLHLSSSISFLFLHFSFFISFLFLYFYHASPPFTFSSLSLISLSLLLPLPSFSHSLFPLCPSLPLSPSLSLSISLSLLLLPLPSFSHSHYFLSAPSLPPSPSFSLSLSSQFCIYKNTQVSKLPQSQPYHYHLLLARACDLWEHGHVVTSPRFASNSQFCLKGKFANL